MGVEYSLRLPFAATSVTLARHQLQRWMSQRGYRQELIDDARLVVSELVANSVRHATAMPDGKILVQWVAGDEGVRLTVSDGGSNTQPHHVQASASAMNGRGMAIVEVLSRRWWTESSTSRSDVHALLNV